MRLLTIPDCPLSAHARHVLDALAADRLLAWHEVSTATAKGEELQRPTPDPLPAHNESGQLLAHGRLSERGLRGVRTRETVVA